MSGQVKAADPLALYRKHRDLICTMDLLQWRGRHYIGRKIRQVTGEDVNHTSAAILFPTYFANRRFSIEAEFGAGLDVYPLSKILGPYDGEVWWSPVRTEYHHKAPAAACWLMERVGVTDYDTRGCMSYARRVLGRDPEPAEASSLFCSESVFLAWRNGAQVPHLQRLAHAPVPGRPMQQLGIWGDPVRIK